MHQEEAPTIKGLVTHVKDYVNTTIDLGVYSAADKASEAASKTAVFAVMFAVAAFFLLFFSITLSLLLSKLTGELYLGFLIISILYLVLGVILWKMKDKWIKNPVADNVIKFLFKGVDAHEKN